MTIAEDMQYVSNYVVADKVTCLRAYAHILIDVAEAARRGAYRAGPFTVTQPVVDKLHAEGFFVIDRKTHHNNSEVLSITVSWDPSAADQ